MRRLLGSIAFASVAAFGAPSAAEVARAIREAGLDPETCFRVRDFNFSREDVRVFLADGHVIFGRPVEGRRLTAVFTAEAEGGDGEVMLLAPHRGERQSLVRFIESPNLNEHIRAALMVASDGALDALFARVAKSDEGKKAPEMGALLAERWSPVARNLAGSFEVRLVEDVLAQSRAGILFLALTGRQLGNFDVLFDPRAREQVVAGQLTERRGRPAYDIWTSFASRSARNGSARPALEPFSLQRYRIEAALDANLHMKATTRATLRMGAEARRALLLEISFRMRVTRARIDGAAVEVFTRESVRGTAIRGNDNEAFLVVTPAPLDAGSEHEIEFDHEGAVVTPAGNGVYYVGSRGTWYPQRSAGFATYDLKFRYPRQLTLVTAGDVVEDRIEGEWRVTRRETRAPVRLAGFNLGEYEKTSLQRAGVTVEVFGNRKLEPALQPQAREVLVLPAPAQTTRLPRRPEVITTYPPAPDPKARLHALAGDVAAALEFMVSEFGPPPLKTLTVSPIPGTFGQGFPGLLYLSTVAYLSPQERPPALRDSKNQIFFDELMQAHETAHQWWGNIVASAGYQDDWLLEALASYSALLYLERKKGAREAESVLTDYRDHLTRKNADGKTLESAGPITWGLRLEPAASAEAWRSITYEKGSWILHMLRRKMGDERFLKLLGELRRRFQAKAISTDDFRKVAAEYLPSRSTDRALESFFDNWVYSTGVPVLKLRYTAKGVAPAVKVTGTVEQSDVDEDFAAEVPVEIRFVKGGSQTVWVRTSSEPAPFSVTVKQPVSKAVIGGVLAK